jgi:hypothetical protein
MLRQVNAGDTRAEQLRDLRGWYLAQHMDTPSS